MGIDPGKTTGIAMYNEIWPEWLFAEFEYTRIDDLYAYLVVWAPYVDYLITERFIPRSGTQFFPETIKALGVVDLAFHTEGERVERVEQMPSQAKSILKDELTAAGGWSIGKKHARDAAAHVVYYVKKNPGLSVRVST